MPMLVQFSILFSMIIVIFVHGKDSLLFTEDNLKDSHGDIIYSSVIFRHGERAPTIQYPTDPYNKEYHWKTYWPQGKGQLSKRGKLQEYNLGKWFRKRYDSLVPEGFRHDLLKVHSSDADRTIMSAKCFLAGFFPPSSNETWTNDGLKWQPVPVRAIPSELDAVIGYKFKCERYQEEFKILNRSPEMKDYYLKHRDVFDYAAAHSGLKMSSDDILEAMDNAFYLYDILTIEKLYNLTLPKWTDSIYLEPLRTIAVFSLSTIAYSHQMRRIKAGLLIGKMMEEMELKVRGKLDETFHLYSGHESTISSVLIALEIYNDIIPPFSSALFFELRRKDEDHIVTILYKNTTTSAPYFLQLPGCEYVCTLENFKTLTKNMIPQNWDDECDMNYEKNTFTPKKREIEK